MPEMRAHAENYGRGKAKRKNADEGEIIQLWRAEKPPSFFVFTLAEKGKNDLYTTHKKKKQIFVKKGLIFTNSRSNNFENEVDLCTNWSGLTANKRLALTFRLSAERESPEHHQRKERLAKPG
jgi:hypothetical protein